ncbi:MAG: hypothetical protein ABSG46_08155 [Candidatus Binataceae bacterium]|jgi:hypothetical protein
MAQHPHREVTVSVINIRTDIPWHEVEKAVAGAMHALETLGDIEVNVTPEDYRKPLL